MYHSNVKIRLSTCNLHSNMFCVLIIKQRKFWTPARNGKNGKDFTTKLISFFYSLTFRILLRFQVFEAIRCKERYVKDIFLVL